MEAIQKQAPVQTSLEELFRAVEDLCALRKQDTLLSKASLQSAPVIFVFDYLFPFHILSWLKFNNLLLSLAHVPSFTYISSSPCPAHDRRVCSCS